MNSKGIFGNFKCFFLNGEFSCLKPYSFLCSSGPIENMPKSLKKMLILKYTLKSGVSSRFFRYYTECSDTNFNSAKRYYVLFGGPLHGRENEFFRYPLRVLRRRSSLISGDEFAGGFTDR
jgi:hypothetical protein